MVTIMMWGRLQCGEDYNIVKIGTWYKGNLPEASSSGTRVISVRSLESAVEWKATCGRCVICVYLKCVYMYSFCVRCSCLRVSAAVPRQRKGARCFFFVCAYARRVRPRTDVLSVCDKFGQRLSCLEVSRTRVDFVVGCKQKPGSVDALHSSRVRLGDGVHLPTDVLRLFYRARWCGALRRLKYPRS